MKSPSEKSSKPKKPKALEPEDVLSIQSEIVSLREENRRYAKYIREKTNQLLEVMGTQSLRSEEFEDMELLSFDPIGIIAGSFAQVLEYHDTTISDLSEAKDELQAIFDATGVGISIIDKDFHIVKYNEKQRGLLVDVGIGEITGRYCYNIYCNKKEPGLDCPALDTFATGRAVVLREVKKKNKYFQVISTPFARDKEGEVTKVIEVSLDITEKKLAEQEEERQRGFYLTEKLKLATVIKSLSEGLLVTDADDKIISVNKAALSIVEKNEGELLGAKIQSLLSFSGQDEEKVIAMTEGDFHNFENSHGINSVEKILAMNSIQLNDTANKPMGRVLTIRDITKEKERQKSFHRAEKLAAVGQLSAGLAHELNTPLGSILGYARLLLKQDNYTKQQKERLGIIVEQAKKSSAIIQGLLNFSRISTPANKSDARCEPNLIIRESIKVLNTEFDKRNISVQTDLMAVPLVAIDPKQFEQVVLNILLNSLQAMELGGIVSIMTSTSGNRLQVILQTPVLVLPRKFNPGFLILFLPPRKWGKGLGLDFQYAPES